MLKELLQYVVNEFSEVQTLDIGDGRFFTSRPVTPMTYPIQKPLQFNTLQSLIDFANSLDTPDEIIAHVIDEKEVLLIAAVVDDYAQRICYAKATTGLQPEPFPFGRFLQPEEFAIQLRTKFIQTDTMLQLLQVTGNISTSATVEVTDDGFTQTVGQKAGVVLKSRAELPTEIVLAPFRTFLEIDQPLSPFFVRARKSGELPDLALFATDGGAWRIDAVKGIAAFLKANLNESIKVFW
jgi:hypothetical protein